MSDQAVVETVLVAEDSIPNRKIIVHLLKKIGYNVIDCEDGKKAWDEIEKKPDNLVAIISDIMMPNMDGIELLKKVRANEDTKEIPFVLITAVSDKDYIMEAKQNDVQGYILKPVTFQRITAKLKELFPHKKFQSAA